MDYQEAIERHIEECKHRIDVITDFMKTNRDANKDKCLENIEIFKTAITAMQELQMYKNAKLCLIPEEVFTKQCEELDGYKQLGTLEEVREAVERQQAKKPVVGADVMVGRDDDGNPIWENDYECAECGMGIEPEYVCCPYCETVIDWSEEI